MDDRREPYCDPTNVTAMELLDAQRTIQNKDVLIGMLREQLKKIEDKYKQNLTDTEEIRYRYCLVNNRLEKIKCNTCCLNSQKKLAPRCDAENQQEEMKQWKRQCEKCLAENKERDACVPELTKKIESFEKILSDHYSTLIGLVENISKNDGVLNEITGKCDSQVPTLQEEIKMLKEENARLNKELETMKRTFETTQVVYENRTMMGVKNSDGQSRQPDTNKYGSRSVSSATDACSEAELAIYYAADIKGVKGTEALSNECSIQQRSTLDTTDNHFIFNDLTWSSEKAVQEPNKVDESVKGEDKQDQKNELPDGKRRGTESINSSIKYKDSINSAATTDEATQYYKEETAFYNDQVYARMYNEDSSIKSLSGSEQIQEVLPDSVETIHKSEGIQCECTEDEANILHNVGDEHNSVTGVSLKQISININDLREELERVRDVVQNIEKSVNLKMVKNESLEPSISSCKQRTGNENNLPKKNSAIMNEVHKSKEGRTKSVGISLESVGVIAAPESSLSSNVKKSDVPTGLVDPPGPKTLSDNGTGQTNRPVYSSVDPPADLISFKSGEEGIFSNKSQSGQSIFGNLSRKEGVANDEYFDWPFFKSISKQMSGSTCTWSLRPREAKSNDHQETCPTKHPPDSPEKMDEARGSSALNKLMILTRHYKNLWKEREEKDQQIKCIEGLLNCYAEEEEERKATDERDESKSVDDYLQFYIGQVIDENAKLKSNIETLLGNVKSTVDKLNIEETPSGREERTSKKVNEECQTSQHISLTISTQYEVKNKPGDLSQKPEEGSEQKMLPSCIFCMAKRKCFGANKPTTEENDNGAEKNKEVLEDKPNELAKMMDDEKLKCEECERVDRGTLVKSLQNYIQNLIDQLDVTKKMEGDIVKLKGNVYIKRK